MNSVKPTAVEVVMARAHCTAGAIRRAVHDRRLTRHPILSGMLIDNEQVEQFIEKCRQRTVRRDK